jgi:hypothetical protein
MDVGICIIAVIPTHTLIGGIAIAVCVCSVDGSIAVIVLSVRTVFGDPGPNPSVGICTIEPTTSNVDGAVLIFVLVVGTSIAVFIDPVAALGSTGVNVGSGVVTVIAAQAGRGHKAVPIEVFCCVVDDPVAVVVHTVADLGGRGVDIRAGVVAVGAHFTGIKREVAVTVVVRRAVILTPCGGEKYQPKA